MFVFRSKYFDKILSTPVLYGNLFAQNNRSRKASMEQLKPLAYLNVPMFDWAYLREDSRSKYIFQISSLGQTADNTVWSHLARAT